MNTDLPEEKDVSTNQRCLRVKN